MRHHSLEKWEKKLEKLLREIDDLLEDQFGQKYRLHPARPKRGKTSNKAHDGLFNLAASFTLGSGSKFGRGYIVDIHLSTLEKIAPEIVDEIEHFALEKIREILPNYFPGKKISADIDGNVLKIHGDISLGML